jgi:hypothetical protein
MKRSLKVKLVVGIMSAANWQSYAQGNVSEAVPEAHLCIHLYNSAGLSHQTLTDAAKEAARILATAGVDTIWQERPVDSPEARDLDLAAHHREPDTRAYLVLRIVRGVSVYPGALGYALPDAQTGVHATIFYDRIERLIEPMVISMPKILGQAMAHEIGHVLLGSMEHSPAGIMKAHWGKSDFQFAGAGFMEFTALQRSVIRERASVRVSRELE